MKAIAVIPARYGSTRFPGKPLAKLFGKPLIQHTFEAASQADLLDKVVVATDDNRIQDAVHNFGGETIMTSKDCPTGTDRVVEAVKKLISKGKGIEPKIVVNVQGDEPLVDPKHIDGVITQLLEDPTAVMATVATRIWSEDEALDRNVVKCVVDSFSNALYFSRALIPHSKEGVFDPQTSYLRHVGLYAFTTPFLLRYPKLPRSPLELSEDLEQLRVLDAGHKIKVQQSDTAVAHGVDTAEQLQHLRDLLKKRESPTNY